VNLRAKQSLDKYILFCISEVSYISCPFQGEKKCIHCFKKTVLVISWLSIVLFILFMPRTIYMGFAFHKVALGQIFLRVVQVSCQYHSAIATHSLMYHLGAEQWAH
jgi:hypothetical protein